MSVQNPLAKNKEQMPVDIDSNAVWKMPRALHEIPEYSFVHLKAHIIQNILFSGCLIISDSEQSKNYYDAVRQVNKIISAPELSFFTGHVTARSVNVQEVCTSLNPSF